MQENNIPVTQSPSEPEIQIEQQPKQSNFIVILLSILLIISVAISGFFAFQTQKLVKELETLRNQEKLVKVVIPEPVATESSEIESTADWKTYSNQKYNFTFRYPGNWNKDDAGSLIAISNTQSNYSLQIDATEVYEGGYCYTWDKETKISIAGKSARMRNGKFTEKPAEICGTPNLKDDNRMVTQIFIPYKSSIELLINYYYPVADLDVAKVTLTQIISTFKFLD